MIKIGNEATLWKVRALLGEAERCELNIQHHKAKVILEEDNLNKQRQLAISNVERVVLEEKKRLNIPNNWPFDPEDGSFLDPNEMNEEQIKKFGIKKGG